MTLLSELGIAVTEGEEAEAGVEEGRPEAASAAAAPRPGADDIGLPGDPVGMYLREMGRTTLLTREGEVALAKRIEAGRRTMLDGLRESPLTMRGRARMARRDPRGLDGAARGDRHRGHPRQRPGGDGGRRERRPWTSE